MRRQPSRLQSPARAKSILGPNTISLPSRRPPIRLPASPRFRKQVIIMLSYAGH